MMNRIIIAADELDFRDCIKLARKISGRVHAIKIHEAYDYFGPGAVVALRDAGVRVWVDFKLYDIPNTVKNRAKALAHAGAAILTVHASGGVKMMRAAREGAPNVELYAVTILTSLEEADIDRPIDPEVKRLALMAKEAGMDGIVCSPKELSMLKAVPELAGMKLITPGVRSPGKEVHDQKRVDTPANAIRNGAAHLVIGRQITQSADPVAALEEIEAEII